MALPWKLVITHLPEVARAAKTVWNHYQGKPRPEIDPNMSVERQLDAVAKRIAALEANEKEQALVVGQIAEQLEGIAQGLKETSARQTITTRLSVVALLLSIAAMVMAYLAQG